MKFVLTIGILFASWVYANAGGCVPASTAAGAVDTCFGTNGKVTTDITPDRDYARAIALQPDGKIVVAGIAGYTVGQNNADCVLIRYNENGSLDNTFSGDGILTIDYGPGVLDDDYCRGNAVQPDGKILIGGRSFVSATTYGLIVLRFNSDGTPDTSFDGDGRAQFEMPAIIDMYAFALQPDGKILIGGRSFLNGVFTGIIARFNSNGSLDTSFGTNGSTTGSIAGFFSITLQPDGKILGAGTLGSDPAFAVVRLMPNGSLDPTFGSGGIFTQHPTLNDQAWFIKQRFDGAIFFGGHSSAVQGDARGTLFHLNGNGSLADSIIHLNDISFWNMHIQPDGKQLTAGASHIPGSGFTIRRYLDVNVPDTTFNGGFTTVKFLDPSIPEATGLNAFAMTKDNKIVAVGSVAEQNNQTTGWRIALSRVYSGLAAPHAERFDFDGDRKADLSIFRPSNGQWWYQLSSNGGNGAAQFGSGMDVITPGDYTGDGRTDMAIWRPSNGTWYVLRSEDFSYFAVPFGTNGDVPRPSDFDGDGKSDLIVYRPTQNFWYRQNSIGLTSFVQFGSSGDKSLVGDFDGDGRSDPAIYRPSTGEWWYRSSINDAQLASRWGIASDVPVPSDFDGDGKADTAVFRPSNGTWYIINSAGGASTISSFGLSSDIPTPADYDGDGKADIAVFRPSQGIWYLLRSTSGFAAIPFGLSSDLPTPAAYLP